jgi:hypothetical protein
MPDWNDLQQWPLLAGKARTRVLAGSRLRFWRTVRTRHLRGGRSVRPRIARLRVFAFGLAVCALSCDADSKGDTVWLRISNGRVPLSAATIAYEPAAAVRTAQLASSGWLAIERRNSASAVTVGVPGFCPMVISSGTQRGELTLTPVIDLGGDRPPLGFDARFSIAVKHGCPERERGQITWRQVSGPSLRALEVSKEGFALSARTPSLEQAHPEPVPEGIVPFSPRTQGRVVLEATWRGSADETVVQTISIPATSRSTGLSSVAVSQQVVLSDSQYRVKSAPQGGHAQTLASGAVALFTPDAPGRWVLESADNRALTLQALRHDKTSYDCGRSECHAQIAATTLTSPMSQSLARQLTEGKPLAAVSCMLDCHVLGERGLDDGGFLDIAGELGFVWLDSQRWQDLPQALRRLGGVRCTACHGPGAIPEPDARVAIVRADVCATCHDAPPRYVHVQQWRSSRMARSDAVASTRSGKCATCHTTSGFLASLGARSVPAQPAAEQPSAASEGIACAACHAPHASHRGARLLRTVPEDSIAAAGLGSSNAAAAAQTQAASASSASSNGITPAPAVSAVPPTSQNSAPAVSSRSVAPTATSSGAHGASTSHDSVPAANSRSAPAFSADASATPASRNAAGASTDSITSLCVRCHSPEASDLQPSAAAGSLHLGRVRVPLADRTGWELTRGPAPHGTVPSGCIGCHGGRAAAPNTRLDHSFQADMRTCGSCHKPDIGERLRISQRAIELRARTLLRMLAAHCTPIDVEGSAPPHASAFEQSCSAPRFTRALYEVRLILEDPAAGVHNASFARELLDDAERQLAEGAP